MTKIVEGRMIVKRLNVQIAPMKGEAIVREPKQCEQQSETPKDGQEKE